jgi:hypothetical protein
MLFIGKDKKPLLTVIETEGNTVTDDGLDFSKDYTLIWRFPLGNHEKTITFTGDELFRCAGRGFNWFHECTHFKVSDELRNVRKFCGTVASLWFILKTDKKLFNSEKVHHDKRLIKELKRAYRGNRKLLRLVHSLIGTYLYIQLMNRDEVEKDSTTYLVQDFPKLPTGLSMSDFSKDWENQNITKDMGITTWEELEKILSLGTIMGEWVPSSYEDVTIH